MLILEFPIPLSHRVGITYWLDQPCVQATAQNSRKLCSDRPAEILLNSGMISIVFEGSLCY